MTEKVNRPDKIHSKLFTVHQTLRLQNRETTRRRLEVMAWCALKSFNVPSVDMRVLRTRYPLAAAVGIGCASVAGSTLLRSSSRRLTSAPFACLSTSASSSNQYYFLLVLFRFLLDTLLNACCIFDKDWCLLVSVVEN